MIVVLVVVVIGGVAALVMAAGASGAGRGRRGGGLSAATVVLVVLGAVGLLVVVGAGGFLMRAPGHDHDAPTTSVAPTTHARSDVARALPAFQPTPVDSGPSLSELTVQALEPDRLAGYELVDGLEPDAVVRVRANGFQSFERGRVEQCVTEVDRLPGCTPPFPVQFGEHGTADFQLQLRDSFAAGRCRAGRPTCTLRISGAESGRQGSIQTVFVDEVAGGRVTVEPPDGIVDGHHVRVSVAGFPAGANLTATVCAAPGGYDPRRCRVGEGTARVRVGPDGTGTTTMAITSGVVGLDRVPCGPRDACGVTVVSDGGFVASPTTGIGFSLGPGAEYDRTRLMLGLATAVLFLLGVLLLIRRTNWARPSEADTPEMDGTDLETERSLDELFGTDEEIDAKYPVDF